MSAATASSKPEIPADMVFMVVKQQFPDLQPPGRYLTPIGVALEQIRNGFATIDPVSAKPFEAFKKTIEEAERKRGEQASVDAAKRDKELKGEPERKSRLENEQFKTVGAAFK